MNELERMASALDDEVRRRLMAARYHVFRKELTDVIRQIAGLVVGQQTLSSPSAPRDEQMLNQMARGAFNVVSLESAPAQPEVAVVERTLTLDVNQERWSLRFLCDGCSGEFIDWVDTDLVTDTFFVHHPAAAMEVLRRALDVVPFDFALRESPLGAHRINYLDHIVRLAIADPAVQAGDNDTATADEQVARALHREVYRLQLAAYYETRHREMIQTLVHIARQYRVVRMASQPQNPDERMVYAMGVGRVDVPRLEGNRMPVTCIGKQQVFERKVTVVIDTQTYRLLLRTLDDEGESGCFGGWNLSDADTRAFVRACPRASTVLQEVFEQPQPDFAREPSRLGESRGAAIDGLLREFLTEQSRLHCAAAAGTSQQATEAA